MTDKDDNNDNAADSAKDAEKTSKVAEKLKNMGVMPSDKEATEEKSRRFSPLLLTILIALPVAGVIAYTSMPDEFNNFISSLKGTSADTDTQTADRALQTQPQFPGQSLAYSGNYNQGGYNQPATWNPAQEPDWVKQQREEMEKRRAEFQKQNSDVEKRRAEYQKQYEDMEKRRAEYQQQLTNQYADNWMPPQAPEPPPWVKQRQEEIEKEIAASQDWVNSPANRANQGAPQFPGYMQHPMMGGQYQADQQTASNQQPSGYQNPNQYNQRPHYNTYNQPVAPYYYYQQPYYGYGPYYPPYGWNGYGYR